ncbi:Ser/Thr protein phosphatase protein [Laetiporus sulphureus 93-53]|uniref:Ser/Thr protein phosphatase protein n=1 Tax=Laetiporus sulphureus 93-53 TaxID=1314785 RepID=A0A165HL84_9APHY|nr:Ser/Thr protein phosphatase protein [Laetiporus sulphureus 93-53]KZT11876.1 Ser/Thr protein phosphatase protein [Laetiporus sulphureus 93-53]
MQIQVLSDLHLEVERVGAPRGEEFYTYDIPVCAEHLALLGDIGWTIQDELFDWLKIQLKLFKTVFFLSGNHEPYRSTIAESEARLKAFAAEVKADVSVPGKFVYLNRTRYDVSPTLTILGCTLWTALNPEELDILSWALTDFRRIDGFDPSAFTAQHQGDLAWLNATVQEIASSDPERKIIVFTHHAPTISGTSDPKFEGQPMSSAFSTELTGEVCWNASAMKLWAFGHTHWSCDFERNGIRVYSNQRGYGKGGEGYDPSKVVMIP